MKRIKRIFLILTILISVLLSAESIYDIQFTENAGGGTYPSTYEGQVVTVSGIVSCNNYNGQKYVLSSSEGGAWQGLLIYDSAEFELGDEVMITGIVMEYYGLTEIIDPYSTDLLSTGNDIAGAEIVNTQEISVTEAYEGVLVEVRDVMISAAPDQWGIYSVDDGTGSCRVGGICYAIGSYDNYP